MSTESANEDLPHPVDVHVGSRIRLFRTQKGLSQGELANRVGVSFQAIQKYEAGEIRISASRLYEVARELGVQPGTFFADYTDGSVPDAVQSEGNGSASVYDRREIMALVKAYYAIPDRRLQRDLLRMMTRMGELDSGAAEAATDSR